MFKFKKNKDKKGGKPKLIKCVSCHKPTRFLTGYHECDECQEIEKKRQEAIIKSIAEITSKGIDLSKEGGKNEQ